ncbi:hypothetical protein K505DRAFT_394981, partial [Melanomma pulvis-pyrius CBS 109.77]
MKKGKKGRRERLSANLIMAFFRRPRLDPHECQLSRFFRPLFLLYALGRTRREHTQEMTCNGTGILRLSRKHLIRKLLCDLADMCDYDKGGDTVTAIGLESRPHAHLLGSFEHKPVFQNNSLPEFAIGPAIPCLHQGNRDRSRRGSR